MRASCALAVLVGLCLVSAAAALENPLPPVPLEQYQLDNGLTVILVEDHSVPLAVVNINYMVGSKDEKPGRTGFAHLFEHMMFKGTQHHNQEYQKALQPVGGQVNGGTNTDRTRYWEQVPVAYLERALWLEADRMGFFLETLDQERLDNQIAVVSNERRQRYENAPYGLVEETIVAAQYPPDHPYSWTTVGAMADIQSATLDDVKEFFRTYYSPNNASLCVVGDIDPEEVKVLIEKYFGAIPPGPPVTRLEHWTPELDGEVRLTLQDRVQLPRTYFAWFGAAKFAEDEAALVAFCRIFGDGKTSRLYRELVYEQQIAQDASAIHYGQEINGELRIILTPRPGHTLAEVEAAALEVLERTLAEGITAEELERTQTKITAESIRARERIGGFSGISDRLNEYFHYLGKVDMYRWDLQRYLDLTPETVTATARRYLTGDRVRLRVEPMPQLAASTSEAATSVDRSVMPGPGNERSLTLPVRERLTLDNGLEVTLVEHHELPVVILGLIVHGGSRLDPPDRAGLASLTAALLTEGAGGRSALEVAAEAEAIGAELNTGAFAEASFVAISALKSRLDESLALFSDVVLRPDFPDDEIERQRQRRLVQLKQVEDSAQYVAGVALDRVIFGDHPYARPHFGESAGIEKITGDDIRELWKRSCVPANSSLMVVGDLNLQELQPLLDTFAAWQGEGGRAPAPPVPAARTGRTVYLIDKPGAAQSHISVGHLGAARTDPSYHALQVVNMVLGGQFTSRLNLNIREDKGYTYGVGSSFDFRMVPGSFLVSTPVQTEVTAAALTEILAELTAITSDRPPTADEVHSAQGSLTDGYATRFETPLQIAMSLLDEVLYGLPADALETYPTQIRAVTTEAAMAAAKEHLHPENLAIVIVGDVAAIRAGIEALELGPVVLLDRSGQPLADTETSPGATES